MSYFITYLQEVGCIIQAIMIDARATTFPANANGNIIQPIVDAEVESIGEDSIPYKIETEKGNLVAYFVVLVNRTNFSGTLRTSQIRPQFNSDATAINALINTFIASQAWTEDFLF